MAEMSLADRDFNVRQIMADHLQKIEGRLKTFMEAITEDGAQCEARKSLVGQMIWDGSEQAFEFIAEYILGHVAENEVLRTE